MWFENDVVKENFQALTPSQRKAVAFYILPSDRVTAVTKLSPVTAEVQIADTCDGMTWVEVGIRGKIKHLSRHRRAF